MNLDFELSMRLRLPIAPNPDRQSLYFFNLYRSGSSLTEAIAVSFARSVGLMPYNLSQALYDMGVEYFDAQNYNHSSVHLARGQQLQKLSLLGGYLFYGFREVPLDWAEGFGPIDTSVMVVRDLRDIGISQFYAAAGHATDNKVLSNHITALRASIADTGLEEFVLRNDTVNFLNRIGGCYRPMVEAGMPVIKYEDMYVDGALSLRRMCEEVTRPLVPYVSEDWSFENFLSRTEQSVAGSGRLKNHKTGGTIRNYEKLSADVLEAYTDKLRPNLELLGYV
ncbi:hypothetical protein [Sulfitobacter sp.]|uniref:hypothetical protein n=1 Tax=Sulfitobacter sp. TaxID=1903071 RepID=UPI003EF40A2B